MKQALRIGVSVTVVWTAGMGRVHAQTQPPTQPPLSVDAAFVDYCKRPDASPWACGRRTDLHETQKFWIMRTSCHGSIPGVTSATPPGLPFCGKVVVPKWIEYSHRTGRWTKGAALTETQFEVQATSRPEVKLSKSENLGIVVTDTNPLVFGSRLGKVTETDIEGLESLKTFVSTLGGSLSGLARALAFKAPMLVPAAAVAPPPPSAFATLSASARPPSCDPASAWAAAQADVAWLTQFSQPLTTAVRTLKTASDRLLAQEGEFVAAARRFEMAAESQRVRWTPALVDGAGWAGRFSAVSAALDNPTWPAEQPKRSPGVCLGRLLAYRALFSADPAKPNEVHRLALEFAAADSVDEPACPSELTRVLEPHAVMVARQAEIAQRTQYVSSDAEKAAHAAALTELSRLLREGRACFLAPIAAAVAGLEQYAGLAEKARAAIAADKRKQVLELAAGLGLIAERLEASAYRRQAAAPNEEAALESYAFDVAPTLFVRTEPFDGPWHKVRETEVIVSRNSGVLKEVASERAPEVTTSYKITPRTGSLWGANVGIVITDITSHNYQAVDNKVAESGRDARSGMTAIFANYKWSQHKWPDAPVKLGVELGAGIDDDTPAILLGLSFEFVKYVRVGVGGGAFRVNELIGPGLGEAIPTGSTVPVKQTFGGRWYASLTFALDSLTLFSK